MHEERQSSSPHIQFVWCSHAEKSGSFEDLAHDFWVIVFRTIHANTEVILTGPITKAKTIHYKARQISWGIVFKAHVFIFDLPKKSMLNARTILPKASPTSFLLGKHEIQLPCYDNAEGFVDEIIDRGIINANMSIAKALVGIQPPMSERTLQRHFLTTTGLTKNKSWQISRARKAFMLLQEGKSIIDVAFEAGYADQAHLTRSLKLLSGQTPGQIFRAAKQP